MVVAGRYRVVDLVGRGSSSVVYAVDDAGVARALKLLRAEGSGWSAGDLVGEFTRLARLSHPNLVGVHDGGRLAADLVLPDEPQPFVAGTPYIVLDLVRGQPAALGEADADARNARLLRIARGLASALELLHARGLVHHDIKPDNVLLAADGEAVLIDLGLATPLARSAPGGARGTLAYMAPEALGGGGDHRVDLYGLGATLLSIARGGVPFEGSGARLVRAILEEDPSLGEAEAWIDPQLAALLARLLRKDPSRRPSSARAVLAELARIEGDHDAVVELSRGEVLLAPAFVGREDELAQLERWLADAQQRVVLVSGAPGVGKSRLVAEALRRLRQEQMAGRSAARSVIDGLPARWIEQSVGEGGPEAVDAMALALADRLEQQARERPLLLVLDSVDEDPLAARLVRALAAQHDGASGDVKVVAEGRASAQQLGALLIDELELAPLGDGEVAALVRSMGRERASAAAERVTRQARGNARLAVELARQLIDGAGSAGEGAGARGETVPGLSTLLGWRREMLEDGARQLVDALAAWGRAIDSAGLSRLVQRELDDGLWADLERLVGQGLVRVEGDTVDLVSQAHHAAWREVAQGALL
ncbi:MAG: protein kinase, partial [Myxococcales bacterium]|nr:protein kinase [Myxococcales bacterium]